MKQAGQTTVLVVPWYERKDYNKMRRMRQRENLPKSYEAWLENAFREMRYLMTKGFAVKIVTIHLDDYFGWLKREGYTDSEEVRSRYIAELAKSGSQLPNAALHTGPPWPGFPTTH